jgi:hypothetical protein
VVIIVTAQRKKQRNNIAKLTMWMFLWQAAEAGNKPLGTSNTT